jgi:hypothetical protein
MLLLDYLLGRVVGVTVDHPPSMMSSMLQEKNDDASDVARPP